MKLFESLFLLERLDQLIRLKATGTPGELASRLGISKRQILRILRHLRAEGFPIEYDRARESYFYSKPVTLQFEFAVDGVRILKIGR